MLVVVSFCVCVGGFGGAGSLKGGVGERMNAIYFCCVPWAATRHRASLCF